ncbi:DsrE/DsrF-like family protein [Lentilactobacillus parabuchneri]|jgi:intracellular sulfur oxidation DsrE/DsrF family protein|uniref:DsrE/DsrF-like family protein n=3 Tax=Lentilactobacillus parabuchneri TaxID=152331 RepID=A0A1X1FGY5_9LACO|nr:DsrE family protein [Lentilactobacillus parabuchneri]APR06706.1 DsrE/DsrF-like family protein [Lentilactobacillus parabuchneri]KRM46793.1 hypothetical protein FC51_GL001704 [Lentilactobacillus parabuchneri DSM 5707 = NBRC 107865]KRN77975.1 hypothetical protein IV42_GL002270 [Lentilactobacillus parabuchneri]MBW0222670.1 DsrE family protein [Lentilactobacillus parabuchneri]MBW0245742.1 DsrE family protein [Lentilactobacillus parabuchneri]
MHKVVFHVDELDKWDHTLSNITNLIDYGQENKEQYHIVVLVNGDAIEGYLDQQLRSKVTQFSDEGVRFHACNNSMNTHGITESQLPEDVEIVSAGVADLVSLQEQGFAYVKA